MGKTTKGAVWLDPDKTTPYEFYQYWRNVGDADVMKFLRMLTFLPLEEIDEMEKWGDDRINEKKEILAYDLTSLVHGKEEAGKARTIARDLFSGKGNNENMPTTELDASVIAAEGISILELLVSCGLATSKSEARRLVTQGGISVDEEKITSIDHIIDVRLLSKGVVIRKGKKVFHKAVVK